MSNWNLLNWFTTTTDPVDVSTSSSDSDADNNDDDTTRGIYPYDICDMTARVLDTMLKHSFYEDTVSMLKNINDLEPSRITFIDRQNEQGLLIDGVKRGWHRQYVEEAPDTFYYGWFYVQYDENGTPLDPWYYCPNNYEMVKYYKRRNAWLCYEYDEEGEAMLHTVAFSATVDGDDYDQYTLDSNGNVVHLQRTYHQRTADVEYDVQGNATAARYSLSYPTTQRTLGEKTAPTLDELIRDLEPESSES